MRMTGYAQRAKLTGLMALHPGTHPGSQPAENERSGAPMTVPETYRPSKCAEVLELDVGDGLILYNHDSSLVHHLNPSAALVWRRCDGRASVSDLATGIAGEHGLESPDVLPQVSAVIAEFDALDLVEDAARSPEGDGRSPVTA
jgi:Coenzyme PQQ synthesis protein D (PqqD)